MNKQLNEAIQKALNTTAGTGGDFLPTPLANEFIDLVREKNFCRQLFRTFWMESKTRDVPKVLSAPEVYYESTEGTEAYETTMTTGTIRLTARKMFAQLKLTEEVIEDAQLDFHQIVRDHFANALAKAEERAMLIGNPAATANASTPAAATSNNWFTKDPRLAWYGLVTLGSDIAGTLSDGDRAANRVYAQDGAMTPSIANQAMYNLGVYGRSMDDLILFLNPWSGSQLLDDTKLVTVDKYGAKATIITGEIGRLYGRIRVIISAYIPDGYGIMTHKSNPMIGDRRKVKIKEEEIIQNDLRRIVISERADFKVEYQDAICQIKDLDTPSTWS